MPKLLFHDADELIMLARAGFAASYLPWMGLAELAMALLVLVTRRWRGMFALQISLMLASLLAVALQSPEYFTHAFNPVTLNLLIVTLATIGWLAAAVLPSASSCLRVDPRKESHRR